MTGRGFYKAVPFFTVQGFVDPQLGNPRLPLIVTVDTTIVADAYEQSLFNTNAGSEGTFVHVAPRRTVTLHDVPIIGSVQQQTLPSNVAHEEGSSYHEWFPFFQLQPNATLVVQDLMVHLNPYSPLLVRPSLAADQICAAS